MAPVLARLRASLLVPLLLAHLVAPASAQPEEAARSLFVEGAGAYQRGDFPAALSAFERSYALRPVPVVLFNLAQTLRALERPAEAIEAYRGYLDADPDVDATRRAAVNDAIEELSALVAFVRFEVSPAGAEVSLGERSLGRAPFARPVAVDPGSQRFHIRAEGHVATQRSATLIAGREARVTATLAPVAPEGTLRVVSNVPADVRVDAALVGRTGDTPLELQLGVGEHTLELSARGYRAHRERVALGRDEVRDLRVDLAVHEPIAGRWWFWAALGGVVLVGVAVAIAVAATASPSPLEGHLPTATALRFGR